MINDKVVIGFSRYYDENLLSVTRIEKLDKLVHLLS
jgi:hypothetical protein